MRTLILLRFAIERTVAPGSNHSSDPGEQREPNPMQVVVQLAALLAVVVLAINDQERLAIAVLGIEVLKPAASSSAPIRAGWSIVVDLVIRHGYWAPSFDDPSKRDGC